MPFDPYESWLGIPQNRRPPTLYQLLGLDLFESDPAAIERAARRQISTVRRYQIGPHSEPSQQILSELARAHLILSDPDRRAAYDAKVRGARAGFPANNHAAKGPSPAPAEPQAEILGSIRLSAEDAPGSASLQPDEDPPALAWSRGTVATFLLTVSAALGVYGYRYVYGTRPPERPTLAAVKSDPATRRPPPSRPRTSRPKPTVPPFAWNPPLTTTLPAGGPPGASPTSPEASQESDSLPAEADDTPKTTDAAKSHGKTSNQRKRTAAPSAEEQLAALGLDRFGQFYLLKQETDAFQKCREAQATIAAYGDTVTKRQDIEAMRQRVAALESESHDLAIEIDALNLQMDLMPRRNSVEYALYAQALQLRNTMRAQKNADDRDAAQIRRELPGPQAIRDLDDAIKRGHKECLSALSELRDLVDSIKSKYDKLDQDPVVRKALSELRLKLGPSAKFNDAARETTRLERLLRYAR